ncbi:MAG: peptidase M15 superfamily [Bacteroidaceae bacterium]|nr:peptidase M15 superfamily [Bacteroidaceae bacterium]
MFTPHFSLLEFTESPTARKHVIANVPPAEAVDNLKRLCENTLEPLREALQLPVVITSGFRTKALNDILAHASERSQHMAGQATDFYIGWGQRLKGLSSRELLIKAFRMIIQNDAIDYDQLILYPTFIHVSYVSKEKNRRTILLGMRNGKLGYGKCSVENALRIQ